MRKLINWARTRPWAVRLFCIGWLLASPLVLLYTAVQLVIEEIGPEIPGVYKECWDAIKSGKVR